VVDCEIGLNLLYSPQGRQPVLSVFRLLQDGTTSTVPRRASSGQAELATSRTPGPGHGLH